MKTEHLLQRLSTIQWFINRAKTEKELLEVSELLQKLVADVEGETQRK